MTLSTALPLNAGVKNELRFEDSLQSLRYIFDAFGAAKGLAFLHEAGPLVLDFWALHFILKLA